MGMLLRRKRSNEPTKLNDINGVAEKVAPKVIEKEVVEEKPVKKVSKKK